MSEKTKASTQREQPEGPRRYKLSDARQLPAPTMDFDIPVTSPSGEISVETQTFEMIDIDSMSLLDEAELNVLDGKTEGGEEIEEQGLRQMIPTLRKQVAIIFQYQLPEEVIDSLKFHQLQYIMQSFLAGLQDMAGQISQEAQASQNRERSRSRN